MAMGHVILKEFFVDREVAVLRRLRPPLHRPAVPGRAARARGRHRASAARCCAPSDLGDDRRERRVEDGRLIDARSGEPVVPNGSIGYRWGEEGEGSWNLDLEGVEPALTLLGSHDELVEVTLPRFDGGETEGGTTMVRGVPARRIGGRLVTTVFDLTLAQYGVGRDGLPGEWPSGYDDADPAVHAGLAAERSPASTPALLRAGRPRVRRQRRAHRGPLDDRHGRRHQPLVPLRPDLPLDALAGPLLRLPGRQRRRLGPLRRPGEGAADHRLADGRLRARLVRGRRASRRRPRSGTWPPTSGATRPTAPRSSPRRPATARSATATPPTATRSGGAARLAALRIRASTATRSTSPTRPRRARQRAGRARRRGAAGGPARLRLRGPRRPGQLPAGALSLWRANLLGSSSKGHEYFLRTCSAYPTPRCASTESPPEHRPEEVEWHDEAPIGKLDLFMTLDFRMNGSCIYSDVVLPAATWYEKHDLSSTDLHPFVHPFNAAIPPPWEAKTDWETFNLIAAQVLRAGRRSPRHPHRHRRRAAAPRHARRSSPSRAGRSATGGRASASRSPARRCRS